MTAILEVKDLKKHFIVGKRLLKALDGVSFSLVEGETFAIVGESGSGKTTLGKTILKLHEPTSGEVYFEKQNLFSLKETVLRSMRRQMQIVFQDPFASLNPRMTVRAVLKEALSQKEYSTLEEAAFLAMVGLSAQFLDRYPHELSGGQRQRVCIARALAIEPKFIVLDEPVSSLDMAVQAQIINLLIELQKKLHLTYLFISHDLAVVEYIADRIAVFYLGKIVEIASKEDLFKTPLHPYTNALITAKKDPINISLLPSEMPSPFALPKGCAFCTRCPRAKKICFDEKPPLKEIANGHFTSCHLY